MHDVGHKNKPVRLGILCAAALPRRTLKPTERFCDSGGDAVGVVREESAAADCRLSLQYTCACVHCSRAEIAPGTTAPTHCTILASFRTLSASQDWVGEPHPHFPVERGWLVLDARLQTTPVTSQSDTRLKGALSHQAQRAVAALMMCHQSRQHETLQTNFRDIRWCRNLADAHATRRQAFHGLPLNHLPVRANQCMTRKTPPRVARAQLKP